MVERYNQGALPSPVVGTPTVDPTAGKAAQVIAEASNEMVQKQLQFATQEFDKAASQFNAAGTGIANHFNHQHAIQKAANAAALQLAVAQKKPEIEQSLNDLIDQSGDAIQAKSAKDPLAPNELQSDYNTRVKAARDALAADSGLSDNLKAHLIPYFDQQALQRSEALRKQAPKMVQNNLQAGINAAFPAAQKVIDNLDVTGAVPENLIKGASAIANIDTVMAPLIEQSKAIPIGNQQEFLANTTKTVQDNKEKLSGSLVSKMLVGIDATGNKTPLEMQQGMTKLDAIAAVVQQPLKHGLQLNGDQQERFAGKIAERRRDYEQGAVNVLKGHTTTALLDDQIKLLAPLEKAENDPNLRFNLQASIDARINDLAEAVKQADKMPEGAIKNATLTGYKSQMVQLIGGASTVRHEADSYLHNIMTDQGLVLKEQSNMLSRIGINEQITRDTADQMKKSQASQLSARFSAIVDNATHISSMTAGPERKEAAQKQALEVRSYVGAAMAADVMSAEEGARVQKQYALDTLQAAHYTDKGPILGVFGGRYQNTPPRTAKQKEEDSRKAAEEEDGLFKKAHTDFNTLNTIRGQIGHSGNLGIEQQVALDEHLRRNFLTQLDAFRNRAQDAKQKPYTPEEEKRWAQNYFNGKMQRAMRGELPEQQILKKLLINESQGKTLGSMRRHYIPDAALETAGAAHPMTIKNPPANTKQLVLPPQAVVPKVVIDGNTP